MSIRFLEPAVQPVLYCACGQAATFQCATTMDSTVSCDEHLAEELRHFDEMSLRPGEFFRLRVLNQPVL